MAELLIYEKLAVLDREKHRKHRIKPNASREFAAKAHAVPLLAAEYVDASREYPIVFARTPEGQLLSLALTGTQAEQNLYLDGKGNWKARYVPAFVQRYPFVFAQTGPDQLTVCIDESYAGFNTKDGEALFDKAGEPTTFMKGVLDGLTEYQRQTALTETFLKKLEASGVLMDAELGAELPDGRRARINGISVVDGKKFRNLPDAELKAWFAGGELGLVYAHLFSLGNISDLVNRLPVAKTSARSSP